MTAGKHTSPEEDTEGTTTKHSNQQERSTLTPSILGEIVNDAVLKVKGNKIFNADLRNEFSHYEYVPITATDEGFCVFKILFDGYLKNGKKEKF